MADEGPDPDIGDGTSVRPGPAPTGMPRWVKAFLVIAILLLLAFLGSLLLGVRHGPRLHAPSGASGGQRGLTAHDVGQP